MGHGLLSSVPRCALQRPGDGAGLRLGGLWLAARGIDAGHKLVGCQASAVILPVCKIEPCPEGHHLMLYCQDLYANCTE